MASFGRQFSGSPVLTMSPQPSHQSPLSIAGFPRQNAFSRPFGSFAAAQRPTITGRKRSRDEAAVNLEPEPVASHVPTPTEGWSYGEGMVLIKSSQGYVADASSQSGTWVDEKSIALQDQTPRKVEDVTQRNFKSQRVERGHTIQLSGPSTNAPLRSGTLNSSLDTTNGPVIDDFTLQLGIGWRGISTDEHIQAAARGWARYIENHYPLTNVRISLESKGLQSYLVEASEGFFLFAESLREGRFVSQDVQGTLRNLQCTPPTFDSAITLTATESPRPTESEFFMPSTDTDMKMI